MRIYEIRVVWDWLIFWKMKKQLIGSSPGKQTRILKREQSFHDQPGVQVRAIKLSQQWIASASSHDWVSLSERSQVRVAPEMRTVTIEVGPRGDRPEAGRMKRRTGAM